MSLFSAIAADIAKTPGKAKAFIDKVYGMTHVHPFNTNQRVMVWGEGKDQELAILELRNDFEDPDAVHISWFQADPQRKGIGTRAMKILQEWATADGVKLILEPGGRATPEKGLREFYKKLGFEPSKREWHKKELAWPPGSMSKKPPVSPDIASNLIANLTLAQVADIKVNFPDADFWIVRRGSEDAVGSPVREFNSEHLGVKVTRTDILDPNYLYYALQYVKMQGYWKGRAHGTLRLKNIRKEDLAGIVLQQQ